MVIEVAWGARTHTGHRRAENQDAVLAQPPVFAVADGMGGHAGGQLASGLAIDGLRALADKGEPSRLDLLDAVRSIDRAIEARGETDAPGMGTTLTGIALTGSGQDHLVVFNIGDSRSYLLRGSSFVQLTHDHSVVQELIDQGELSAEQAEHHPERHVITRSLGSGEHLDIDWWSIEPKPGDRYLLCSDGLTKELHASEIHHLLTYSPDPTSAAQALLDAALNAGARDNVSVVVVNLLSVDSTPDDPSGLDDETNPRAVAPTAPPPSDDAIREMPR